MFLSEVNDELRTLLQSRALGHLVTINADGSPQVSVVWIGFRDDRIVAAHLGTGQKIKNIARDPRVALTVEAPGVSGPGLANYLIVHGWAEIIDGGAPQLLQELAETYLGPGIRFPPMDNPPEGHVISITIERIGGVGPWSA